MDFVTNLAEKQKMVNAGGKAQSLSDLFSAGFPIPPGVVIMPEAFYNSLSLDQRRTFTSAVQFSQVQPIVDKLTIAEPVCNEIEIALGNLSLNGEKFAVRSSALEEDSANFSFAGQLQSFLSVRADNITCRIVDVWKSGYHKRVLAYRRRNNLEALPKAPGVIIQKMIHADVSGVAFSADPVSGRRGHVVVASVYGLATSLVSGECDADTYYVNRKNRIIKRQIAIKTTRHQHADQSPQGFSSVPVAERQRRQPSLSDDQVLSIARLVRRAEQFFNRPQDIEWAIEGGRLYLLQSRPITTLVDLADPEGKPTIWDNSNIAESYGGITLPFTFTFIRRAYEEVYRQFCKTLNVPKRTLAQNDSIFSNMLGFIGGRIYYNLVNWYRLLALLPGYSVNRGFMEQMMGVKERLPEQTLKGIDQIGREHKIKDGILLAGCACGIMMNYWLLERKIRHFYRRLNQVLGTTKSNFALCRPDELVAIYQRLEDQLLSRWDAPIINDFFAMIFYGLLKRLSCLWCGDKDGTLQNELLCNSGGMVSTEPAIRVEEMARIASRHPRLIQVLCNNELSAILEKIQKYPELYAKYNAYLEKFGERCMDELKLESPTLHDNPLVLLRSVGFLAQSIQKTRKNHQAGTLNQTAPNKKVVSKLNFQPFRRIIFDWVLKNTRRRVRDRENLRFARTRVFGQVRKIFVEIGRRFYALDFLENPRDIFYLELDEVMGFIEGTSTCTDLKGLVVLRKKEFERYARMQPPADRFRTRGIVYQGNTYCLNMETKVVEDNVNRGTGCSPGRVTGQVRIVKDPLRAQLNQGNILVAKHTDPSWILLFPFAAGLLIERGSLLSHAAIVAREMRIPAIVALPGVTQWLKDGDRIEMDGKSGEVRKITHHAKEFSDA